MRVLLTRARGDAEHSAGRLAALGHVPVVCPLSKIVPTGTEFPGGAFEAVVATSAHAFSSPVPSHIKGLPVYAVGQNTATAARHLGFANAICGSGSAEALAARVIGDFPAGSRVLFVAGQERKPTIEARLAAASIIVSVVERYRAVDCLDAIGDVDLTGVDVVLHYSRASACRFARAADKAGLAEIARRPYHLCLSDDVSKGLASLQPLSILRASVPDEASLFALLAICRS